MIEVQKDMLGKISQIVRLKKAICSVNVIIVWKLECRDNVCRLICREIYVALHIIFPVLVEYPNP